MFARAVIGSQEHAVERPTALLYLNAVVEYVYLRYGVDWSSIPPFDRLLSKPIVTIDFAFPAEDADKAMDIADARDAFALPPATVKLIWHTANVVTKAFYYVAILCAARGEETLDLPRSRFREPSSNLFPDPPALPGYSFVAVNWWGYTKVSRPSRLSTMYRTTLRHDHYCVIPVPQAVKRFLLDSRPPQHLPPWGIALVESMDRKAIKKTAQALFMAACIPLNLQFQEYRVAEQMFLKHVGPHVSNAYRGRTALEHELQMSKLPAALLGLVQFVLNA